MKKLATMTAAAALMLGFAGAAQAGGGSDTTFGDDADFHCYLFFVDLGDDDKDAQAMINGTEDEANKKVDEMIAKYTDLPAAGGLGGTLVFEESVGNLSPHNHAEPYNNQDPCSPKDGLHPVTEHPET